MVLTYSVGMRRADRLFQIVQFLRSRRLTTAQWLAERLQISVRTVYRDIDDLSRSGVPIEGERGVGYVLRRSMDLPPLMFDRHELAAIELGLRFTQANTQSDLARAAMSALAKIRNVQGPVVGPVSRSALLVPRAAQARGQYVSELFDAVERRAKVRFLYRKPEHEEESRTVHPLGLFFWAPSWSLLAWCERRDDFRSFRLDRLRELTVVAETYEPVKGRTLEDYLRKIEREDDVPVDYMDPDRA